MLCSYHQVRTFSLSLLLMIFSVNAAYTDSDSSGWPSRAEKLRMEMRRILTLPENAVSLNPISRTAAGCVAAIDTRIKAAVICGGLVFR